MYWARRAQQWRFADRHDAGRRLAPLLQHYAEREDAIVLGLPRGGVPVAYEIARRLQLPLDVFVVRKLGVPGREELAMGAVASGGICRINDPMIAALGIDREEVRETIARESREVERREAAYRGNRPAPDFENKTVILTDDGLATGATMAAAVAALRDRNPARIVVAVPVAPREVCAALEREADEVVCLWTPEPFEGVGQWYVDFSQLSDDDVRTLLAAYPSSS